jgi:digeranylgeranylglycerophospholipid reductase
MIDNHYDIVVIGAGPAGSTAARFAAEKGAKVLILERDREPGIPVRCAEGVSHHGLKKFIEPDEKWIAARIDVAELVAPNGTSTKMYQNGTGYVLERRIFDTVLCNLACEKGATLLTKANATGLILENQQIKGVQYTQFGEDKEVFCHLVIGADGVESRVGRWAGINTTLALDDLDTCVQYTVTNIKIEPNTCRFFFGTNVSPGGYVWVFPKSATSANIGIGIAGNYAEQKGPKEYLDEFMAEHYPEGKINYTVCGGVPTAATLKDIAIDNLMLVGDAARQVNPITGGGIIQGMIAAKIAGTVAGNAVIEKRFDKKFLKTYLKEWNDELGKNQKIMYSMKEKFMTMNDERFNNLVKFCNSVPREDLTVAKLFKNAVKDDPKLVIDIAKAFVISKIKK